MIIYIIIWINKWWNKGIVKVYKFTFKLFSIIFAMLFVINSAFALNAEFKNSLMKIEVIKTAESNYNLDLYTKTKFLEPVKIIKKSDLNYYVLLPETKNESVRTVTQGSEIRSISTNVYPYAGQDVNNGYVKISINTTKPINFKVNVKNSVAAAIIDTKVAQAILEEKEIKEEKKIDKEQIEKAQKKNSDFSISKKSESLKKVISQTVSKKEVPENKVELFKIEEAVQKEVERVREETMQEVDEELASLEQFLQVEKNNELITKEDLNEIEQIVNGHKKQNNIYLKLRKIKNSFSNNLERYGIDFGNFITLASMLMCGLFIIYLLLARKEKETKRLKRKAEFDNILNEDKKEEQDSCEIKNDGQYFIFDKNIKQTGFCDPATSAIKRNYELSSYEPELKNKYNRNSSFKKNSINGYDIIQKILKEDTIIDLPNGSFEQQVRTGQLKMQDNVQKHIVPQVKQETQEVIEKEKKETESIKEVKESVEPEVLANVEIAPQRGFMLVSYDENINLLGYIFDDVFALYNFKQPKLEKYDIKYRLSEKDDKIARFIVKVGQVKMLVAVSKTSMEMEVLL